MDNLLEKIFVSIDGLVGRLLTHPGKDEGSFVCNVSKFTNEYAQKTLEYARRERFPVREMTSEQIAEYDKRKYAYNRVLIDRMRSNKGYQ